MSGVTLLPGSVLEDVRLGSAHQHADCLVDLRQPVPVLFCQAAKEAQAVGRQQRLEGCVVKKEFSYPVPHLGGVNNTNAAGFFPLSIFRVGVSDSAVVEALATVSQVKHRPVRLALGWVTVKRDATK